VNCKALSAHETIHDLFTSCISCIQEAVFALAGLLRDVYHRTVPLAFCIFADGHDGVSNRFSAICGGVLKTRNYAGVSFIA
jgi:hypothetical protein